MRGEEKFGREKLGRNNSTKNDNLIFGVLQAAWTNFTRMLTRDRFRRLTCNFMHKDDWRVSVSSTLVESDLTEAVLGEG